MKKLFVLIFVGLCSQSFCMDFGVAPEGENLESIREQDMMEELNRLSDYFAHNDTGETPVESPAQAFREMSAYMQNLMTFDQEHMRNFGIGVVDIAAGRTVSCDWIRGILEENSDSDNDELIVEGVEFSQDSLRMVRYKYGVNFMYIQDIYNALELFMRRVGHDSISDGQSKMISRMCKVITVYGDECYRIANFLQARH